MRSRPARVFARPALARSGALAILGGAILAGCSADAPRVKKGLDDLTDLLCEPKEEQACTCATGAEGVKRCNDLGTKMGACRCDEEPSSVPTDGTTPVNDEPSEPPPSPPKPLPNPNLCGNGIVDAGEACDDGNAKSGDGCSDQCQPDGAPAIADRCLVGTDKNAGGQKVTLWPGRNVHLAGSTEGYNADHFTKNIQNTFRDRLYQITPAADGEVTFHVTFDAAFPGIASLRHTECWNTLNELWATPVGTKSYTSAPVRVTKGQRYYLFLDATADVAGRYTVDVELQ